MVFCVFFANTLGVLSNGLHFKRCKKSHCLYLLNFGKNCSNFEGKPKDILKTSDTDQSLNKHRARYTVT